MQRTSKSKSLVRQESTQSENFTRCLSIPNKPYLHKHIQLNPSLNGLIVLTNIEIPCIKPFNLMNITEKKTVARSLMVSILIIYYRTNTFSKSQLNLTTISCCSWTERNLHQFNILLLVIILQRRNGASVIYNVIVNY